MKNKVLIIAAHPDDEILGCGGTVGRLINEGAQAYTLILGEGVTSRDEKRDCEKREGEIKELREQAYRANEIIGVKETFIGNFADNRFDTVPFLEIVKAVEKVKDKVRPDIIFTHYTKDLNIDHQVTHQAVLTAARPLPDESVKEIYSFEVLSSTEWNYPLSFSPDVFFDISQTLDLKLEALSKYKSEIKCFPHPRSPEGVKINAAAWGMKVGVKYAEAFKCLRILR